MSDRVDEHSGGGRAVVVLSSRDLDADLAFFEGRLGFRLLSIEPADAPARIELEGFGLHLRLDRTVPETAATLVLPGPPSGAVGDGAWQAPNGTRILWPGESGAVPRPVCPAMLLQRASAGEGWHVGRAGMLYRDLVPDRLGGGAIASHIRIPEGGPVADRVHFHEVRFQLIHCLAGWVDLVYEDQGAQFRLQAGDGLIQPPGIRHRVLHAADGLEVLEVGLPAEHPTRFDPDLALPTATVRPDRLFEGQRFLHYRRSAAAWRTDEGGAFGIWSTDVETASGGAAAVRIWRAAASDASVADRDGTDIRLLFIAAGSVHRRVAEEPSFALAAGDALVLPASEVMALEDPSADFEMVEVALR